MIEPAWWLAHKGETICGNDFTEVLATLLTRLPESKQRSRAGDVSREAWGIQLLLQEPHHNWAHNDVRKPSYSYACGELAWYLCGSKAGEFISYYAPSYTRFLLDGVAPGAYGPRIVQQLPQILTLLCDDPTSRRAVISIHDGRHDLKGSPDVPCTLSLQFLIREERLTLITTMRSNDVWLGLPYDVFAFSTLQLLVAACLGYQTGPYLHQVGSMHLYADREPIFLRWMAQAMMENENPEGRPQPLANMCGIPKVSTVFQAQLWWESFQASLASIECSLRYRQRGITLTAALDRLSSFSEPLLWILRAIVAGLLKRYGQTGGGTGQTDLLHHEIASALFPPDTRTTELQRFITEELC